MLFWKYARVKCIGSTFLAQPDVSFSFMICVWRLLHWLPCHVSFAAEQSLWWQGKQVGQGFAGVNLFEVWKMLNLYFKNHAPEILSPWLRESILTSNGQNRNPEKMNWATLSAVKYTVSCVVFIICNLLVFYCCLQCFDTVGWAAGRASGL